MSPLPPARRERPRRFRMEDFVECAAAEFEFPAIFLAAAEEGSRLEEVPGWAGSEESESMALRSAKDPPFLKEPATSGKKRKKRQINFNVN